MNLNHNFTKMFKSSFKKKVRITAGLIVTFLISGNISMAVEFDDDYNYLENNSTITEDITQTANFYNMLINYSTITGDITQTAYDLNALNNKSTIEGNISQTSTNSYNSLHNSSTITGDITQTAYSDNWLYNYLDSTIEGNISQTSTNSYNYLVNSNCTITGDITQTAYDYNALNNDSTIEGNISQNSTNSYNYLLSSNFTITGDITQTAYDYNALNNYSTIEGNISQSSTNSYNYLWNHSAIIGDIVQTSYYDNNLYNYLGSTINGNIAMTSTAGYNYLYLYSDGVTSTVSTINGDVYFYGNNNSIQIDDSTLSGTGAVYGDTDGNNVLTAYDVVNINKNIYDMNSLEISYDNDLQGILTLTEGYEITMNSVSSYTSIDNDGESNEFNIYGTLTLNTTVEGSEIYVPKIDIGSDGVITVYESGTIKFTVSGDVTEDSYEVIFGGDLTQSNVISDGSLVVADDDNLFVETLGWSVSDITVEEGQTTVTLLGKDVYDELMETTQDSNETKIINILDNGQDTLGIHEALSNVAVDDAETAISQLSGEIYSSLSDGHIKTNKMFTGKINSMMSSPLTLRGERQSDFALLLENSTAELSSDTFTQAPNYSFLEGEEKYIQHFDILGTTGSNDKTGVEYDTHASGFVGITERIMGNNSSLGLSYGYYDSRNDYDDGSDSEAETFYLGMTHKLYFGKDYMLASYLGTEYSKNDVTREITTLDLQANSDYDSYSVSIGTDLSKNIKLSERVTMVPSIGVGYSRIERESFTESGSIGSAALDVESLGLDSVTSKLGLRLDVDLTDKLVWCVGGSWEHEYADLNKDQEASFVGDADSEIFEIEGANIDEDTYSILTGFNYNVNDSLTYRIMYSFTQQDDLGENNIDLGVSWKF